MRDQRPVELRPDVLCYTSEPLERDLALAGPVRVVLYAASSSPDTDFSAKLVDVSPNGVALNLCEGIARARWRDRASEEKDPNWLIPGEPARLEIDLWSTACLVRAGHRVRVEISSSNFPRFDRNPNTRDDPAAAVPEAAQRAEQTVFHDAERASHALLPVLPR